MIKLSEQEVNETLATKGTFVIKAGASWCGPCKAIKPALDEVEKNHENIPFYEIDVDENQTFGDKFKLRSVPTVLFFKDGEVQTTTVGNVPKEKLEESIKFIL